MLQLLLKLYPQYGEAIAKLRASGFDPFTILALIRQFGPDLLDVIELIINTLKPRAKAAVPVGCDSQEFDALECALVEAVCAAHCARLKHCGG